MAKHDIEEMEYTWDAGTYQTGATNQNKGQSAVITGLLIAVIFLGGLASALGLMNVRLLGKLVQQQNAVLPVSMDATAGTVGNFLRENQTAMPLLPENRELKLTVGDTTSMLSGEELMQKNQSCMATLRVQTSQGEQMTGPALVISSDGYLLTNAHLTENASYMTVQLSNGEQLRAVLVATDVYADLAVLYVQAQGLSAAVFSDASLELVPGVQVYALSQCDSLSESAVLDTSRELNVGGSTLFLQETNFNTDHGPVFSSGGQVAGFLCRYFGSVDGGMMLSSAQVMEIATQLVQQGQVHGRPGLGLQVRELSNFCRQYWALSGGLEITELTAGGMAEQAGLLEGDILLSLNGSALVDLHQFYAGLLNAEIGDYFEMEVFRAGQRLTVTVQVAQVP